VGEPGGGEVFQGRGDEGGRHTPAPRRILPGGLVPYPAPCDDGAVGDDDAGVVLGTQPRFGEHVGELPATRHLGEPMTTNV